MVLSNSYTSNLHVLERLLAQPVGTATTRRSIRLSCQDKSVTFENPQHHSIKIIDAAEATPADIELDLIVRAFAPESP